jgi:hypothetical protein
MPSLREILERLSGLEVGACAWRRRIQARVTRMALTLLAHLEFRLTRDLKAELIRCHSGPSPY